MYSNRPTYLAGAEYAPPRLDGVGFGFPTFGPNLQSVFRRIRKLQPGKVLAREVGLPSDATATQVDVVPQNYEKKVLGGSTALVLVGLGLFLLSRRGRR